MVQAGPSSIVIHIRLLPWCEVRKIDGLSNEFATIRLSHSPLGKRRRFSFLSLLVAWVQPGSHIKGVAFMVRRKSEVSAKAFASNQPSSHVEKMIFLEKHLFCVKQGRAMNREKLSLDEVHDKVKADALGKWDAFVPKDQLIVHDGRMLLPNRPQGGGSDELSLSPWATMQMCQRLGIPTAYYRKCPPDLRDAQANHWLQHGHTKMVGKTNGSNGHPNAPKRERWLLRAKGETLRGVLSEHYTSMDDTQLLDSLRPVLNGYYQVDWFGLSEESLHLRVVDPRLTQEVLKDDALSAGVHISNSEVGARSVVVDALVWRLVCANGLIRLVKGKSLLRQRHIHISTPRFEVALEEAVAQAVQTSHEFVQGMKTATKQPVPDVEKALEKLGIRFGLPQSVQDAAKQSILGERADQQHTVYGLVNGLTRAAQALPDEERYSLEVLAGRLVESGLHGLDGDGSKGRNRQASVIPDDHDGHDDDEETPWSAVEAAREMFDAEVMNVVPHRKMVEAGR